MEHYLKGFEEPCRMNSFDYRTRLELLQPFMNDDTEESIKSSIVAAIGNELNDDGTQHWPYSISCIMRKSHMCETAGILWSAFCFHNDIPFGRMIAYPHIRGMLDCPIAYIDLLDSWCVWQEDKLWSMHILRVKDREG